MGQDESSLMDDSVPPVSLTARSLSAVADYIESGQAKRIVVMTGAGISTAAGIPDFRSPKTGLYSNLARLNLPYAEAVFDISYFRQHPEPFYVLANELYPGKFYPTVSHAFIALLAKKDLLSMLFTQNIDCLERRAGVPGEKVVEAHGSFATQRCIECQTEFPDDRMKEHVFAGEVPQCGEKDCGGLVKPDIVFFGEALPKSFGNHSPQAAMADLVLIIGTSLTVYPFASLPDMAKPGAPRVLFNMERVGKIGSRADDVVELGASDAGIRKLADKLGWRDELETLWRDVVGEEEAQRQLQSQKRQDDEVEDEVEKLAEGIEDVLNFDEPVKSENGDSGASAQNDGSTAYVPKLGGAAKATVGAELAGVQPGLVSQKANAMDGRLGYLLAAKQTEANGDDKPETQDGTSEATGDDKPKTQEGTSEATKPALAVPTGAASAGPREKSENTSGNPAIEP